MFNLKKPRRAKKVKDTEYLYLSTMLNCRSIRMLTRDKMERMLDASTYEECAKMLEECGYGDLTGATTAEIEAELSNHRAELFDEISALSPQQAIVDVFRLKYDYHNIKVLIKSEGAGVDGNRLLSGSGRVDPKTLTAAFNEDAYNKLPEKLAAGLEEAKGVLARTANPQLADIILDKYQFEELRELTEQLRSSFIDGYTKLLIDSANLRTTVRTLRIGRDHSFLRGAILPGGNVDIGKLIDQEAPGETITAAYGKIGVLAHAAGLGSQALTEGSLADFELACDNAATLYLTKAKSIGFGQEPVITFIASLEGEITAARMILTGRLQGLESNLIRERLRDSYA